MQQGELSVGQVNALTSAMDLAAQHIDLQVCQSIELRLTYWRTPQQAAHARQQLSVREGLDQIVISSQLKALDPVLDAVSSGKEQHRRIAAAANQAQQLPAVHAGQHDIEYDQVEMRLFNQMASVQAMQCGFDLKAGFA